MNIGRVVEWLTILKTNESMTYFGHIGTCIAKSFTAEGRTSLVQYACLTSFQWLICLALVVLGVVSMSRGASSDALTIIGLIGLAYLLVSLPTMWNATIRRLHDISSSGGSVAVFVLHAIFAVGTVTSWRFQGDGALTIALTCFAAGTLLWALFIIRDLWTLGCGVENDYGLPPSENEETPEGVRTLFKYIRVGIISLLSIWGLLMVVGTVCGYFVKGKKASPTEYPVERHSRYIPDNELETALREVNKTCPQKYGPITYEKAELSREERILQYNYTVDLGGELDIQKFKTALKWELTSMVEQMKRDPKTLAFLNVLLRNNFGIRARYVIKPSNEIVQDELSAREIRQILDK